MGQDQNLVSPTIRSNAPPQPFKNKQDTYQDFQELHDKDQEIQETLKSCRFSQDSQTTN